MAWALRQIHGQEQGPEEEGEKQVLAPHPYPCSCSCVLVGGSPFLQRRPWWKGSSGVVMVVYEQVGMGTQVLDAGEIEREGEGEDTASCSNDSEVAD